MTNGTDNPNHGAVEFVTRAEYARHSGLSRARVTQLGHDGLLVLAGNGLVDVAATDKLRSAAIDPMRGGDRVGSKAAPADAKPSANALLAARTRELYVRIAKVRRRARQLAAASVSGWEADDELQGATAAAVAQLRAWPRTVARSLVAKGERVEVHETLTTSIEALCNAIAGPVEQSPTAAADADLDGGDIAVPERVSPEAYKAAQAQESDMRAQAGALEEYLETGVLVPAEDIEALARDRGVTAREALLAVPDRTSGPIAASADIAEIEALLAREIENVCSELLRERRG